MNKIQKFFFFFSRITMSTLFLYVAAEKVLDWQMYEIGLTNLICDWHAAISNAPLIERFFENLLPYNTFLLLAALVLQVIGAALLFFGSHVRIAAGLLIAYLVPVAFFSYRFWITDRIAHAIELEQLLKNLTILGGLLAILAIPSEKGGVPEGKETEKSGAVSK